MLTGALMIVAAGFIVFAAAASLASFAVTRRQRAWRAGWVLDVAV